MFSNNKSKYVVLLIVIGINIYLLFNLVNIYVNLGANSEFYSELTHYAAIFITTLSWLYNNINFIFVKYHKLIVLAMNPSVSWALEYHFTTEDIKEKQLDIILDKLHDKYQGEIDARNIRRDELSVVIRDFFEVTFYVVNNESNYEITIKATCRASYRDSLRLTFIRFDELKELLQSEISRPTDIWYSLSVCFDEYNPFYKIITRPIESISAVEFNLNYNIGSLEIRTFNNAMEIISDDYNEIREAARKYVAISTSKLFK